MRRSNRSDNRSDRELVLAARSDDGEAFGELFDRWFNSSWNVARTIVRHDETAADVAQDALLAAWQRLGQLDDPDAFGGWLLRITRNRALTRLEREQRSRATGDEVVSGLRDRGLPDPTGAEQPLGPDSISEVRDRQELVWAAAAALGEREVSLLDLHLRHGLSAAEIAEELGVEPNNAHQQLFRLRNRLGDAIGSYLLWRNGRPLCEGLAAAMAGDVAFDRSVAKAVSRHQAECEHCSERRAALLDPGRLFAGVPLVLVPTQLKAQAAAALQSAGVPFGSPPPGSGPPQATDHLAGDNPLNSAVDTRPATTPGNQPTAVTGNQPAAVTGKQPAAATGGGGAGEQPAIVTGGGGAVGRALSTRPRSTVVAAAAVVVMAGATLVVPWLMNGDGDETVAGIESEAAPGVEALAGPSVGPSNSSAGRAESGSGLLGDDRSNAERDDGQSRDLIPAGPSTTGGTTPPTLAATTTRSGNNVTTVEAGSSTGPSISASTTATIGTTATTGSTTGSTATPTPSDPVPPTPTPTPTPTPVPPTPTPTPNPPPADPPVIIRFASRRPTGVLICANRNQGPFEAIWSTENADSVTLTMPNGTHQGAPSGSYQFCASSGDTIRLLAVGPGGQDKSSTSL